MNDIPIINALPEKYRGWAIILALALPYATRMWHALVNGGGLRGVWGALWFGTNTPPAAKKDDSAASVPIKTIAILFLLAGLAFGTMTGCGKATLESGGAYAPVDANGVAIVRPDLAFFEVDSAYDLAYSAVHAVFKFERDNRALLWKLSPDIKHTLDKARPQAVSANVRYAQARKAYLANPVPANLSTLQTILAEMQSLASAASAAVPKP
jgi:hypothetical protein